MPAIDSIAVAAMAMPYRPASACAPQIAMHPAITGIAVDFLEMPRPAMMLVPWPVVDAAAMCCTGLYWVPVEYSVIHPLTPVSTRPIRAPHYRVTPTKLL